MYVFEYAGKYIAGVCISTYNQDTCCILYLTVEENYAKDLNSKKVLLEVDYGNIRAKKLY